MRHVFLGLIISAISTVALSYDFKKCFDGYTKMSLIKKKYDYNYAGPWWVTCRTSGKESSTTVAVKGSFENITMSVDPGVTLGRFSSTLQFTSSWGACSIHGSNSKLEREQFIAHNLDEVKRDAAFGGGEFLSTLAQLSSCSPTVHQRFAQTMQQNYETIHKIDNVQNQLSEFVDRTLVTDPVLQANCQI